MITAEEIADGICVRINPKHELIITALIEFAKLHCIEQAIVISEKARIVDHTHTKDDDRNYKKIDKDSILNAYPLDLIK